MNMKIIIKKQVFLITAFAVFFTLVLNGCYEVQIITTTLAQKIMSKKVSKPQVQTETASSNSQPANNSISTDYKWTCTNGQKIYEGEFELFGRSGKAKYQYREGPDRSRIFDGHFIFGEKGKTYAEGDFKDNHQVGKWEFEHSPLGDAWITFDEDSRIIRGSFSHQCGTYSHAYGKFIRPNDGHRYGPYIYGDQRKNLITFIDYNDRGIMGEGGYNLDGEEDGEWRYQEGEGDRLKLIKAKYDDGKLLDSYYIERSTGDKILWGVENLRKYTKEIVVDHWQLISAFFIRDTRTYY